MAQRDELDQPDGRSDVEVAIARLRDLVSEAGHELSEREHKALDGLEHLGAASAWPMPGWAPGQERAAARVLNDVARIINRVTPAPEYAEDVVASPVPELFRVSELMDISPWAEGNLEAWHTRRIRFSGIGPVSGALHLARMNADVEPGAGRRYDQGWHLHPMNDRGEHLGYKCLFDPDHGQGDLSWELHSRRGKATPWGDPATQVLATGTAESLHRACLAAVRRQALLRGSFKNWASLFQRPSPTDAYLAHPPPTKPIAWGTYTGVTRR